VGINMRCACKWIPLAINHAKTTMSFNKRLPFLNGKKSVLSRIIDQVRESGLDQAFRRRRKREVVGNGISFAVVKRTH